MSPLVTVDEVVRTFRRGTDTVRALRGVTLHVEAGELVALVGRSGSGKTTLLNLIGGLDRPDGGEVVVDGNKLAALDDAGLLRLRREWIGFVFQSFGLLPYLSARENVGVPLRMLRTASAEREERVDELLRAVALDGHAEQRPAELSGGQQQRVAIARALAAKPALLLADEPTGQLDSETGRTVIGLLRDLVHESGSAALVATHDQTLVSYADRVLHLHDGRITVPE
ncbi:ABC transporter ATP-binding protein [Jiangella asiatica]|uniref:ABC transporter ATP-binding protein n=1 Tax=Jiangella asiatica TaxID=2530372 RepID=A0A4R5CGU1_9ACTN|nr:ABC transporter ATP-binding protein [Jiangella asiatica]TDD98279.1 ABC transporter ATP-binding protein [Jiangella asiatica]